MFSLTFFGTACGQPMADRFHSSLLVEADGPPAGAGAGAGTEAPRQEAAGADGGAAAAPGPRRWRFLLDAGEPCSQRLRAAGVPLASLDAVFLSHGHSDHVGGLPMLLQGAWLEPRRRGLPVYLPRELIAPLTAWLEAVYLPAGLLGFAVAWHGWEDLVLPLDWPEAGLRVEIALTTHLDGLRARIDPGDRTRFRPYALALSWPAAGKRLVYSADLGTPGDLAPLLGRPADLLVCELAHYSPEALWAFLAGKPVRRLALTHLAAERAGRTAALEAAAAAALPDVAEVRCVRDGDRLEF